MVKTIQQWIKQRTCIFCLNYRGFLVTGTLLTGYGLGILYYASTVADTEAEHQHLTPDVLLENAVRQWYPYVFLAAGVSIFLAAVAHFCYSSMRWQKRKAMADQTMELMQESWSAIATPV
jgi:hypothetical protein